MNQVEHFVRIWGPFSKHVSKARDITSTRAYKYLFEGGTVPQHFAESRTVFIPKTSDIDDDGRIIRSPDALRPLTLCNCGCKLLTSAICRGLHWYNMRRIHPSQRCISSRHMTDDIFEIETTASAHVAFLSAGIRHPLDGLCCCLSSVNHAWILSVIEKTELPEFISRFLRSIYNDSITHVEFAGTTRGQFLVVRGVRQGCPASGFIFAVVFVHIFRWLQETVIQGTLITRTSCSLPNVLALTTSL